MEVFVRQCRSGEREGGGGVGRVQREFVLQCLCSLQIHFVVCMAEVLVLYFHFVWYYMIFSGYW